MSRIAINLSLNELKRRKKQRQRYRSIDQKDMQIPSSNGMNDEMVAMRDMIQKALARLNDKDRALVLLRMINGYSVKETAVIMNIPQGSVASGLSRAQKKIRSIITELNLYEKR